MKKIYFFILMLPFGSSFQLSAQTTTGTKGYDIYSHIHYSYVALLKSGDLGQSLIEINLAAIKKQVDKNPAVAKPYFDAANEIQKKSQELYTTIETLKNKIATETGGFYGEETPYAFELVQRDNTEKTTQYMLKEGYGATIKSKINSFHTSVSGLLKARGINPDAMLHLNSFTFIIFNNNWESETFEGAPLCAVFNTLAQIEIRVLNATAECLSDLAKMINASDFRFDNLEARVIPKSTMVLEGEKFEADIFLTANNSMDKFPVQVNGSPIKVENGVGKYTQVSSVGFHKYKGSIEIKAPDGTVEQKTFEGEFTGFKASATISPDKMNILYRGLENPITVAITGARAEDAVGTFEGATATLARPGCYIVEVDSSVKEIKALASVKGKLMGTMLFRVKNVPLPFAIFGIKETGTIAKAEIPLQTIIWAGLDPTFPFERMKYIVTKYTLIYTSKKKKPKEFIVTGNLITEEIKKALKDAKSGDLIAIKDIEAMGPYKVGPVKLVSGVVLTVE